MHGCQPIFARRRPNRMPAPRATEAVIRNAIKAAQACNVAIGEVIVEKDGTVRIVAASATNIIPFEGAVTEPRKFGQQR